MKLRTCGRSWGAAFLVEYCVRYGRSEMKAVIWELEDVMLSFQLREFVRRLYTRYAGTGGWLQICKGICRGSETSVVSQY